jgi:hypothetical protein
MRVPALVISPYARRGYISGQLYEHASILKFIERRFGLSTLASVNHQFDHATPGANNDAANGHPSGPPFPPRDGHASLGDLFEAFDSRGTLTTIHRCPPCNATANLPVKGARREPAWRLRQLTPPVLFLRTALPFSSRHAQPRLLSGTIPHSWGGGRFIRFQLSSYAKHAKKRQASRQCTQRFRRYGLFRCVDWIDIHLCIPSSY